MKKIAVLMSTYNGEKYLKQQIDSILNQEEVDLKLYIRDDGSKDNTKKIIKKYLTDSRVTLLDDKNNLGPARSFMKLLSLEIEADYFAFADQDDYWMPQKLSRAISKIENYENTYAMYISNKEIVDENLDLISNKKEKFIVSFETAMMRNIATGCTMVINKNLKDIINSYNPDYLFMHDEWIYRTCLALNGFVFYDEVPFIKYRQHSNNVIGSQNGIKKLISRRIKSLCNCTHERQKTAQELIMGYSKYIDKEKIQLLNIISNYDKKFSNKIKILKNKKFKTENIELNMAFKIAVLINKI